VTRDPIAVSPGLEYNIKNSGYRFVASMVDARGEQRDVYASASTMPLVVVHGRNGTYTRARRLTQADSDALRHLLGMPLTGRRVPTPTAS